MATLKINDINKNFGKTEVLKGINLDIKHGEFLVLLGPSGCGKSTLLNTIAGLETSNSGDILIDDHIVNNMEPSDRDIALVFQSYALYPAMTVRKNVTFGLEQRKTPKEKIAKALDDVSNLLQITQLLDRKPSQLSGGQRQRVALARALIKQPKVLLLDEPLAALDKKLREQTQFELINLQYELGITFVVVTHDQEEAMTLSDRLAVMDAGRFIQTGTPTQVYESPNNRFVADFFGTINFFNATVVSADPATNTVCAKLEKTGTQLKANSDVAFATGTEITIAVRPEKIIVSQQRPEGDHLTITKGTVEDLAYYGNRSLYRIRSQSGRIIQVSAQNYQRSEALVLEWDDEVFLSWDSSCNVVLSE
jgi:spermidine/putrescine ABC transporter ATP-binding subunit